MIRLLKQHQIDEKKYNHCISMDASGLPYGYTWYLNTLCEWQVLVKNDYEAVWPLPLNRKYGIAYYYRPYSIQQLGIFSKKPLSDEDLVSFVNSLCSNVRFADVYMNEGQLPGPAYRVKYASLPNYVLPLHLSYQQLYEQFSTNTKRNVKKAVSHDLQLFEHDAPKVLLDLFKQNVGVKLKLEPQFYKQMERGMFTYLHHKMGKLYTVYGAGNQVVAAAFIIMAPKRQILLSSAISDEGKRQAAMHFLMNEHFIFNCEQNVVFDFEGSMNPGIAQFNKGFGAELRLYTRMHYNGLPTLLQWLKK